MKVENIVLSGKFWMAYIVIFVFMILFSDKTFYICTGNYSEVYHSTEYCDGLNPCRNKVKIVNKKEVIELNRRPCMICNPSNVYEE